MLVRHFMTTDLFTLSPGQTCREALAEFKRRRIRRAPVVADGALVGIVSERDLLRVLPGTCAEASSAAGENEMAVPVRDIMVRRMATLGPNDPLAKAADVMLKKRIGGLPVLQDGKLKGIITESDVFKALHAILSSGSGATVIFEAPGHGPAGSDEVDYAGLCLRHGCRLHTFLRYPNGGGGATMYFLRMEGGSAALVVRELWALAHKVLWTEGT
jgi:CBS domain-containing protein